MRDECGAYLGACARCLCIQPRLVCSHSDLYGLRWHTSSSLRLNDLICHICQVTLSKTQPPLVHSNPLGMFDLPGCHFFLMHGLSIPCAVLFFFFNHVHPGRLTWNIQITHFERKMIFQTSMRTCSMLIFQGVSNGRFSSKKRCEQNINQSCNLSFVPGIAHDHQRLQAKSLGVFLGAKNKRNQQKQKRKQTSNTRWWQLK